MSKEVEAQILYIDYDKIIDKIKSLNAELKFDWTKFRIAVFHPCLSLEEQKEKYDLIFTRVRDEGKGITTITTKTKLKSDGKFVNEYEIETKNSFDECKDLLLANHLSMKAYQERLRQKWIIPGRPEIKEIVFDIWPGLPMHMEIEAKSEQNLMDFISELGINKDNIRYSGAAMFYEEILGVEPNVINNETPQLNFATVKTALKPSSDNAEKFNKILEQQKSYLKLFGFESLLKGGKRHSKKHSKKSSKNHSKKHSKKSKKVKNIKLTI
jgi:adenylate cyclase class IV